MTAIYSFSAPVVPRKFCSAYSAINLIGSGGVTPCKQMITFSRTKHSSFVPFNISRTPVNWFTTSLTFRIRVSFIHPLILPQFHFPVSNRRRYDPSGGIGMSPTCKGFHLVRFRGGWAWQCPTIPNWREADQSKATPYGANPFPADAVDLYGLLPKHGGEPRN